MRYPNAIKINSFQEVESSEFLKQQKEKLKNAIESKGKEYIIGIDETDFKNYLIESFTIEPLRIDIESEEIGEPIISKEWRENRYTEEKFQSEVYTFTIKYRYSGSAQIFRIKPNPFRMASTDIYVDDEIKTVSFSFELYKRDPKVFLEAKNECFSRAFDNLEYANVNLQNWNLNLVSLVNTTFQNIKNQYLEENDFFAAINIKVNKNTTSVFTSPTVKKSVIPQPVVSKYKKFSSEPTMDKEMYDDLLRVVYDSGKNMEKKPALYKGKDEEGLRDQFLFVLETRYEGATATGETFNRSGKTDIILKYAKDGSNLFVAECKFWHGASEYLKAISQLFDRYLTWRDSKVALIVFVTNNDFSNVLQTIDLDIKKHPYFIKDLGKRGESSFSYLMHLPQDIEKQIFLEVLAFHYDKK